jgi:hypothetical protein
MVCPSAGVKLLTSTTRSRFSASARPELSLCNTLSLPLIYHLLVRVNPSIWRSAWRQESLRDAHYADRIPLLDPHVYYQLDEATGERLSAVPFIGIGEERLKALVAAVGAKRVAAALTHTKCTGPNCSGAATPWFSYLACARQCKACFRAAPAELCTMSFAKVRLYLMFAPWPSVSGGVHATG